MNEHIRQAYEVKAQTIIKNLEKRYMAGYYCESTAEAQKKVLELLPAGCSVGWGGSATLDEIGVKPALKAGGFQVIDRDAAKTPEDRMELMRQTLLADTFLTSTNAITLDGELVNIDGNGNRVAAICFGPKSVIVVAGMNKVAADLACAIQRVRTEACPANGARFHAKTPCTLTGKCGSCFGKDCLCGEVLTTRLSKIPNRIKVVLVGEPLGF